MLRFVQMYDPTFRAALEAVFGPGGHRRAELVFDRLRRTIQRWCSGQTRVPRRTLVLVERRARLAPAEVERWKREQHERIEDEARERLAAAGQALTWAKLLTLRAEREPPPKMGRPPKRLPLAKA